MIFITEENNKIVIGAQITRVFKNVIDKYIENNDYISIGDFVRTAIREKMKRDAPELMRDLYTQGIKIEDFE